jgi:hypothetical protein
MSSKTLSTCRCSECTICTASHSKHIAGRWRCDKGALTTSQAKEKKRRVDEAWNRLVAHVFPTYPLLE